MKAPGVAPGGMAGVAALRLPARVASHEYFEDMAGLHDHQDRRVQRRKNGFEQETRRYADDAAGAAANAAREQGANQPERFWDQQHHHAEPKQRHHECNIEPRPGREQLKIVAEVFWTDEARLERERKADADHQQPNGRGQITHDATARCMRLMNLKPALPMIFMCCKLPCAQRRSRIAISINVGGDSSQEPPQSVAMRTFQPPRRMRAASTKSCESTKPPKGLRPLSCGRPQYWAKAATRMMALWPQ